MAQTLQNLAITTIATYLNATFLGSAIGVGTTAPDATQTVLVTESMRVASTNTLSTTNVSNDTATMTATFNITTSLNVSEAGQFTSSSSGGTMLCRATFTALPLVNGDSIITIWKLPVSGA